MVMGRRGIFIIILLALFNDKSQNRKQQQYQTRARITAAGR